LGRVRSYRVPAIGELHDHYVAVREHIMANGEASPR